MKETKGTVLSGYSLIVRDEIGNEVEGVEPLKVGDTVYGKRKVNRIYFESIHRADGTIEQKPGNVPIGNGFNLWMTLTKEPEPQRADIEAAK